MAKKIAIVIVNYNNWKDTEECLCSLPKDKTLLKIIVNQNTKESPQPSKKYSDTKIITLNKNIGFAAANNIGIRLALRKNIPYVFLLNNDTVIFKDTLTKLYSLMETRPNCGIASPVNYFYQQKNKVAFSGGKINYLSAMTPHYSDKPTKNRPTAFITGAAMLIRSSLFKKIGLMAEDYFLYYEDADLCQKAKTAGAELWIVANASILHKVSQTAYYNPFIYYYCQRNRLYFFSKYCPKIYWPLFIIIFLKDLCPIIIKGLFKPRQNNNFINLTHSLKGILDFCHGKRGKNKLISS